MERVILHSDMNNFYASVECMLDMSLRGHPVAVGGDVENRHGIILAKNYEAKKFGVQTGEALWQARMKCKNLIIVPPHYEQYIKYSKLAREIYSDYTNLIEPYGMDECWLDVTGCMWKYGSGENLANIIRERMQNELELTVSVGVSFNKIFAKLGSDMKKPDAVTVIPRDTFREKIWDLPASDLLGVGRATEKVLTSYGIKTIGDLAKAPQDLIQRRLGKRGLLCMHYANGLDISPVAPAEYEAPVKSVGHGITTRQDLENPAEVWNIMLSLTQDIGHKLRVYDKRAAGVQIDIRDNQLRHKQWQCQMTNRTNSSAIIANSEFVVANKDGEALSYTQFRRVWAYVTTRSTKERTYVRYVNGQKIKHIVTPVLGEKAAHNGNVVYSMDFQVTPHQLRHTYITNLIFAGVDPKTVQYLAGHENSKITMDIYAKVKYNDPDSLSAIVNTAMDKIYAG